MILGKALLAAAIWALPSLAAYSHIADDMRGHNFFDAFNFYSGEDPTHGFVRYVDRSTAQANGLINANDRGVFIGVDSKNIAPNGRMSVRIESKRRYTRGLFILDAYHMPYACGAWPAWWTFGDNWPNNGEIDIIEGVHTSKTNHYALHTSDNCWTTSREMTGQLHTSNCFVSAPGQASNEGCAIKDTRTNTWGTGFNSNNGGVYAMEWNSDHIKIWFFPRGAIPPDVLGPNPEPASWGLPAARFSGGCDINSKFREHKIVFNITFCGDWAGNVWNQFPECQARANSCQNYVANQPGGMSEAWWGINSLRVFSH